MQFNALHYLRKNNFARKIIENLNKPTFNESGICFLRMLLFLEILAI